MISDSRAVVTVATEVRLGSLLLLNLDSHDFDLVVRETNLNFKLIRHDEFVSFNRVIVVLLLLLLLLLLVIVLLLLVHGLLLLVVLLHVLLHLLHSPSCYDI